MKILLPLSLLVFSSLSLAAVDQTVSVRGSLQVSDVELIDEQLTGLGFEGAYKLSENFELGIGLSNLGADEELIEVSVTSLSLFSNIILPLSEKVEFFGQVAVAQNTLEVSFLGFEESDSESGHDLGLGVNVAFNDNWSGLVSNKWKYIDGSEFRVTSFGAGYRF